MVALMTDRLLHYTRFIISQHVLLYQTVIDYSGLFLDNTEFPMHVFRLWEENPTQTWETHSNHLHF